ncbi:hypothetical protein EVA_08567 [gut metagenome]|uniref:DUF4369 domain-containing protein n=1 Tax=gut metagenome TaxID=749906 RepID=J9GM43_9ZZZZ
MVCGACTPTHSTRYTIEGEGVDSVLNGRYLYLQRYDDRSIIDSAKVVNQRYVFHGDIDTAVYCYIDTKSWSTAQLMLEPGTIRIHTENRNSSVKGTVLNDSWACWNAKTDSLLAEIKEQQRKFQTLCSPSDTLQERWTAHYRKTLYPQLAQHFQLLPYPDHYVGGWSTDTPFQETPQGICYYCSPADTIYQWDYQADLSGNACCSLPTVRWMN